MHMCTRERERREREKEKEKERERERADIHSPGLLCLGGNLEDDRVLSNMFYQTFVSDLLVHGKEKSFASD